MHKSAENADASLALSICIVNWNTREHLRDCLASLANHPPSRRHEIIVVDNASEDGSADMVAREFPDVRLIANERNEQYARANNQAIRASAGDMLLLLNPDVQVLAGAIDALLDFMDANPAAGACAPKLVHPDGRVQRSVRSFPTPGALLADVLGLAQLFPRSETLGRYRLTHWDYDSVREVDQPMASALMLRRKALRQVGLFDEQFPLFFNDVDLCYRLRRAAWRTYFVPQAQAIHHVGASTAQARRAALRLSQEGLARFYRKHYRGALSWPAYWG
ncbi:MAG: glycosyltransferase family 2 protein, partial [Armatimonadota bacterium]